MKLGIEWQIEWALITKVIGSVTQITLRVTFLLDKSIEIMVTMMNKDEVTSFHTSREQVMLQSKCVALFKEMQ